jgi:hypothetical protein
MDNISGYRTVVMVEMYTEEAFDNEDKKENNIPGIKKHPSNK